MSCDESTSTSPKLEWRLTIQYIQYSQDSQIDQVFYHNSIYKFQSNHSTLSGRQKKKTELVDELTHALLSKLQGTQLNNMQDEQNKFNLNIICGIMLPTVITRPCTNQNQNAFQKSKLASFGNWKHGEILNITRFMFLSINNKFNAAQQKFWKLRFLQSTKIITLLEKLKNGMVDQDFMDPTTIQIF
ncbi:Hypothetical_protein [Hexamita inflata]|uniref:Hypothetical_protein n=1 Tax=Hexamita inflata TaxID=28002 RepID=A0AA86Q699_9EUKA|nr:Hypothetical protein HINF_LOCUS40760 [Hexamita inflata]